MFPFALNEQKNPNFSKIRFPCFRGSGVLCFCGSVVLSTPQRALVAKCVFRVLCVSRVPGTPFQAPWLFGFPKHTFLLKEQSCQNQGFLFPFALNEQKNPNFSKIRFPCFCGSGVLSTPQRALVAKCVFRVLCVSRVPSTHRFRRPGYLASQNTRFC